MVTTGPRRRWRERVGVYIFKCLVYSFGGWFVERVCDAGSLEIGPGMLFRSSLLVGCHVGPFLSGPESETAGRHPLV